jgi:hypothetical protein
VTIVQGWCARSSTHIAPAMKGEPSFLFFYLMRPGNNVWFQTLLCMRALRNKAPTLNRDLQRGIGEKLRAMYGEMMEDHIPSRHLHLLQRFERDEASGQVAVHQMFPSLEKIGKY